MEYFTEDSEMSFPSEPTLRYRSVTVDAAANFERIRTVRPTSSGPGGNEPPLDCPRKPVTTASQVGQNSFSRVNGEPGSACAGKTRAADTANNPERVQAIRTPVSHSPGIPELEKRMREKGQIQ